MTTVYTHIWLWLIRWDLESTVHLTQIVLFWLFQMIEKYTFDPFEKIVKLSNRFNNLHFSVFSYLFVLKWPVFVRCMEISSHTMQFPCKNAYTEWKRIRVRWKFDRFSRRCAHRIGEYIRLNWVFTCLLMNRFIVMM